MCQHCGKVVARANELTLHHVKELTPENVGDYNISLNPENVAVVHYDCHGEIHHRFGHQPNKLNRSVYIIYGPPMSGKTTLAKDRMQRGDIVVDIDKLYAAVSMLSEYDKPDNLFSNVRGMHNLLIDNIKTRFGKWNNAFIVGGYADKYKREKLANDLGAELIFCDIDKKECMERLNNDEARKYRHDEWSTYINKWFDSYMA
jgi:adenylate kinase family enzyme